MSRKKGAAARLEFYREALDQVRRDWPHLPLTPLCFFDSWTDAGGPPPALSKAAEYFGLHVGPAEEAEEALLLHILAEVVFGGQEGRPRARPSADKSKLEVLKLIQLAIDCNKVQEETPSISDKKAVAIIKIRYGDRYKYATAEMMRQRLGSARQPQPGSARWWLENENGLRADRGMAPLTSQLTRPIFTVE